LSFVRACCEDVPSHSTSWPFFPRAGWGLVFAGYSRNPPPPLFVPRCPPRTSCLTLPIGCLIFYFFFFFLFSREIGASGFSPFPFFVWVFVFFLWQQPQPPPGGFFPKDSWWNFSPSHPNPHVFSYPLIHASPIFPLFPRLQTLLLNEANQPLAIPLDGFS